MKKTILIAMAALAMTACTNHTHQTTRLVDTLRLKDYLPENCNNIPVTTVEKAKYPVIDIHSHDYATTKEEVEQWVKNMDACGITETHVMHCEWIGEPFETFVERYGEHKDRFRFWCCFDYTQMLKDGSADEAIAYLEKCHAMGAVGVGEMGDKGEGDLYARPTEGRGLHIDDPRMQPLLKRCAELRMPISIHIAEPYWMYLPEDKHNDGLPNAAIWHVDTTKVGCLGYNELMASFENALRENPQTIFIACHFLNMNQDLPRLGALLDTYPNLYVDIAGRVAEAAQTPRATRAFLIEHQDQVVFGTDNGMDASMYRNMFRVLETEDEHFYIPEYNYHWALSAFYLPDTVLEKIYYTNSQRILNEYK